SSDERYRLRESRQISSGSAGRSAGLTTIDTDNSGASFIPAVARMDASSSTQASFDNGCARPAPAADGIQDRAFDHTREPTDRRHLASLAMYNEGPVKLPILDGSDMHAAGVPFHEYRP